ncbi:hypothetical protein BISA_1398, partial [Bifidobacterium saguini DSM 23967]
MNQGWHDGLRQAKGTRAVPLAIPWKSPRDPRGAGPR